MKTICQTKLECFFVVFVMMTMIIQNCAYREDMLETTRESSLILMRKFFSNSYFDARYYRHSTKTFFYSIHLHISFWKVYVPFFKLAQILSFRIWSMPLKFWFSAIKFLAFISIVCVQNVQFAIIILRFFYSSCCQLITTHITDIQSFSGATFYVFTHSNATTAKFKSFIFHRVTYFRL